MEQYFGQLSDDLSDTVASGEHTVVHTSDVVALMRQQRVIHKRQTLESLAHRFLPMEYVEMIVPVARANNVLDPSSEQRQDG